MAPRASPDECIGVEDANDVAVDPDRDVVAGQEPALRGTGCPPPGGTMAGLTRDSPSEHGLPIVDASSAEAVQARTHPSKSIERSDIEAGPERHDVADS
jgi:hypothetical protein